MDTPTLARQDDRGQPLICWHRELPPLDAQPMDEHVVEATSSRVPNSLSHRDEFWDRCHAELMRNASTRLAQEVERLGGDCAHVLHESIESRTNDQTGEAWLHGTFTYMLYRQPPPMAKGSYRSIREDAAIEPVPARSRTESTHGSHTDRG